MKRKAIFLSFIAKKSTFKIILFIVSVYLGIAAFFSIFHFYFDTASLGDMAFLSKLKDYIYISFQIQTTLGVTNEFSEIGKLLIIPHQTFSIFYIAIIPAIAAIKIATPPPDSILFCDYLVFYPKEKCFRTRYVNRVGIVASDIDFDIRYKISVEDVGKNIRNFNIFLAPSKITNAEPMKSYYLRTKQTPIEVKEGFDSVNDFDLVLHPYHIRGISKLIISIRCNYLIGY